MKNTMKGIKIITLVIAICLTLLSCFHSSLDKNTSAGVISSKDGLQKDIIIDSFFVSFQLNPTANLLKREGLTEEKELKARTVQLDSMFWFNVSISIKGFNQSPLRYQISSLEQYESRLNYYLNEAANDFSLVVGNSDTLLPSVYWFENNQNLLSRETMIIGYQRPKDFVALQDLHLSYFDRIFGNGIIKATIESRDLKRYLSM